MAGSVIHDYRVALIAALTARAGLAGVRVSYGPPLPRPPGEFIWIAGSRELEPERPRALGRTKRREEYTQQVVVSVSLPGNGQQAAADRAFALLAEVEDTLRLDPSLDAHYAGAGEIIDSQFAGVESDDLLADDKTRESLIKANITVKSRI